VITARQIRALRESYKLSRREFGALTRIGEASLARWESGEIIQSFGYDQFLYLLSFPENLQRLRERRTREQGSSEEIAVVAEYPLRVEPDPEGGFVASISDLPGCYSFGETQQEAIERLEESRAAWLESYRAMHGKIPEPADPVAFSGRVLMRMPKYLHRKLRERARDEGVSVNQYLVALVAEGISRREPDAQRGASSAKVPQNRTVGTKAPGDAENP